MDILQEKNILVTGATSGIGFRTALELAGKGANVIGAGRDPARCEAARQRILSQHSQAKITYLVADLSSKNQVKSLAEEVKNPS
jgi:NAD(P)-dependent dehydrogenase (short-subunit alcohol dehydrogenase family)